MKMCFHFTKAICSPINIFSHREKNTMWLEGKWMQVEDIMLSEIIQVQKQKGPIFSIICGR
jgi:hypothetical protein